MKKRFDLITELYDSSIREITENPENWMNFLRFACRNYLLPFDEQVLVYVQRPEAEKVLSMEDWSNKFGRWVKRDSKKIAVFDKEAPTMRLKYYYDVSDTREGKFKRLVRPVPLWEMENSDREAVQETISNTFGVEESGDFEETILEAAKNAAEDNLPDYLRDLLSGRENSFLEELDELNVEVEAKRILEASVAYMLMARCGVDTEAYYSAEDFRDIRDFNTPILINLLGSAVSDVAEMALSPVSDTVIKLQKGREKENRTFVSGETRGYTESVKTNPDKEGSAEYERNRIQQAGRVSSAEHLRTGRDSGSPWEIFISSEKISSGTTIRDVHNPADTGQVKPASGRSTGGSTDKNRADHDGNGTEGKRDGGTKGRKSDVVGREDEQHPSGGRGSRDEGTDLQLEWYDRSSEDKRYPFFGSDSDIKSLLLATPHLKATKEEIRFFYESHEDKKERTEYIKSIFNNEFTEVTLEDGRRVGYKTFQNVLHLWEGKYLSRTAQSYYDWGVIAEYFEGMRLLGELGDRANPAPIVGEQLRIIDDMAEEKSPAFSFTQEIIDYTLIQGSGVQYGKYRIYSYFLQGHTTKEKAEFLKEEYGMGGRSSILAGTGIGEDHDAKGLKLNRGYGEDSPELLLSWGKVAKRIDELITAGRYMSKRELEYIPEYEKGVLATEIYNFFYNQPEEVMRPYPAGAEYYEGLEVIRAQFDETERVEKIIHSMDEVLDNTADFAKNYQSMQKTLQDMTDYKNGVYSLFTPIPPAENTISSPALPVPAEVREKIEEKEAEATREKGAGILEPYDLQLDTIVFIGLKEYRIEILSPERVVLRDELCPIFAEEMPREEFERKVRENPANDHLKIQRSQPELPDEKGKIETKQEILQAEKQKSVESTNEDFTQDNLNVAERNYHTIMELAPGVLQGEEDSATFEAGPSFMPLTIEVIGNNRIAISHFIEENGDLLADPDMEFEVSHETKTLNARMYQQDTLRRFENVIQDGMVNEELENELNEFAEQWFTNIREQGYKLVTEPRFEVEQTSDAFAEPFAVRDRKSGKYYDEGGVYQTFRTEQEAEKYAGMLNRKETEPGRPDVSEGNSTEKTNEPQEENRTADFVPIWEQTPKKKSQTNFLLHPEIPKEKRNQYHIGNDELGQGTPKEKFRANIAAIQMLKKCEYEGRLATPEEQEWLSGYVGWGGLSDAFDETKTAWSTEYLELKTVLTPEEYAAARESTLTAFYTPPVVIRAMYQVLENMGLKSGNILEPSCGIGNFIGMKPESLSDCRMYGVELDSISGRIARQLYQRSTVAIQGYEEANLPDSFFDVAVGNVPFGQFKVLDQRYDKHNFLIHDYFFAKTLDKVRPGGVIAFITSSGTMDKKNPSIRKYIAQRAELLGAIRLPNDTFKENAGTEVTADILFLQKRDRMVETEPDWMYLDVDENGITQNHYFVEHPEMVLGEMVMEATQYGMASTCRPYEDKELESLLLEAVENIEAEIEEYESEELMVEETDGSIPADPSVPNFSYTMSEGKIYYRENSRMKSVELSLTGENRVKGMIAIRDLVRELIDCQTMGYPDEDIDRCQKELNRLYDVFRSRYGLLNARANSMVFSDDNSYPLLCSLEILKEDGTLLRKADMFTKRTIRPHKAVEKADTAAEALSLSLSEKARVDMEYMCSLTGKRADELEKELSGVIFRIPDTKGKEPQFVSEDEYLSGNVREKLKIAELAAQEDEVYQTNVEALKKIQPKELTASEINVRLGTIWIPPGDIEEFMFGLLDTPNYKQEIIKVHLSECTGEWWIEEKGRDKGNVKANNTYGTHRASAYKIIEDTLNLRDTRIFDYEEDAEGKKKAILNKEETAIAQGKQDLIKQEFQDWIWKKPERRQRLTDYYNEHFNAIRPREYDGSHLKFPGINPEITLRQHQKNGAARIIYGGNSLLAYVVGAGKTYTMVAAAMECKRLGLCSKSMIVVPNHIIEQFAAEWLQLYPAANLLVATKRDFETKNRKKFCARIATSEIDAVIIGHSQFEKIPISVERQRKELEDQIADIIEGIREAKRQEGSRFTVKQLQKSKKSLEAKLKKLNDQSRKDDVVTFEELGIDRLFVDEADNYKNLYLYTKMRNVGGIAQTEAQKSSDMFMKCRYLDEVTGGKGVIFATGTPVSNSMVELYTMQRYLQYKTLVKNGLQHFDAWASTFGETVTAIELAPEGTGYRLKTRFARFFNLPELMQMFREVADIQTADMLNLPVPEAEYRVVTVKPSDIQKEMVEELGNRAERVRNGMVNPMKDNMLLITNDGRKLALDQRLANEMLPDEPESKVNACAQEVWRFWISGREKKLTQLVFCDLSTPRNDGTFSVYNDLRKKLMAKGIPPEEIAFIHDANTEVKKKELFSKVRRGAVRVLMGSTFKMGAGTNVQDLIIASHDLDCPWRPRDLEQRAGRTVRQGNKNKKVDIIRYVTEGTFDAYLYQVIENKQKFISQIMTSKSPARSVEDIDETALSYAEIKALATGNPHIKEKMDLDIQVSKLQLLKQSFLSQKYEMEDKVTKHFPDKIRRQEQNITAYEADILQVREHTPIDRETFPPMQIDGMMYYGKKEAGQALIEACKAMKSPDGVPLGDYRGLLMELSYDGFSKEFVVTLKGSNIYHVPLGTDIYGNITRIDNEIEKIPDKLEQCREKLESLKGQLETAKVEAKKEFPKEKELSEKVARLGELNALLDMDKEDRVLLDGDMAEDMEVVPGRRDAELER